MRYLTEGLVAGGVVAGLVWYATRDRDRADRERATAERVARLADARAQLATAIARADGAITAGNAAGAAARADRERALADARARLAAAIARADGAIAAGNAAGAAAHADHERVLADARAQLATAIARADGAIVAGNAAGAAVRHSPPEPQARERSDGLSRRFDDLFARHGRGIPVAYLRALAQAESGMNPNDRLGLINVVPKALADYNERHPEQRFSPDDMREPAKNITVAADHLRVVIDSYRRHHPDIPNLAEDWRNPHFALLVTAGWNGGHSERAGVGRVVRFLKAQPAARRPTEITIDAVFDAAARAQATHHLSNPRKLAYAKGVVTAFLREVERDARDGLA